MPRFYVDLISVHPNVAAKIQGRSGGGCTVEEVREAFQNSGSHADMKLRPGTDPPVLAGFGHTIEGKRLFAALVALDAADGTWALMTAYPV